MREFLIFTGTVTYAIKGRDILRKNGIEATVKKKNSTEDNTGCGYAIAVKKNIDKAEQILRNNGIRILKSSKIF